MYLVKKVDNVNKVVSDVVKVSSTTKQPRGDVGVEYVLSTPLRVVRGD